MRPEFRQAGGPGYRTSINPKGTPLKLRLGGVFRRDRSRHLPRPHRAASTVSRNPTALVTATRVESRGFARVGPGLRPGQAGRRSLVGGEQAAGLCSAWTGQRPVPTLDLHNQG